MIDDEFEDMPDDEFRQIVEERMNRYLARARMTREQLQAVWSLDEPTGPLAGAPGGWVLDEDP